MFAWKCLELKEKKFLTGGWKPSIRIGFRVGARALKKVLDQPDEAGYKHGLPAAWSGEKE